jgi:hypothetical protein
MKRTILEVATSYGERALMVAVLPFIPYVAALAWVIDPEVDSYMESLQDFAEAWRKEWEDVP